MGTTYDSAYCYKKNGQYFESLTLSLQQREALGWLIKANLDKTKTISQYPTSYWLKSLFERALGFYVSNADCKKAMIEAGFRASRQDPVNWTFNVSKRSVDQLRNMVYSTPAAKTFTHISEVLSDKAFINIRDPVGFAEWIKESSNRTLDDISISMGLGDGYLTDFVLNMKRIPYSVVQMLSLELGEDVGTIEMMASLVRACNIPETQNETEYKKEIAQREMLILKALDEQNKLLKEIGKILTNIETITESTWK